MPAKILAIGTATLDIINEVDGYPQEDDEVRAVAQHRTRGGNAANTLSILCMLGHQGSFGGVLVDDENGSIIRKDFDKRNVDWSPCQQIAQGTTPTSYICRNRRNGSRTIVHYRQAPEYNAEDFKKLTLSEIDWLHFEGRNVSEVRRMIELARKRRPALPISVEIEKPRPEIEQLFGSASVLLFSKHYAVTQGWTNPQEFLRMMDEQYPVVDLVCAWGEDGAYARDRNGEYHVLANVPEKVVDTLGAGDTFNAGVIHGRISGMTLQRSISFATELAGKKCGFKGFDGFL